jgi:hypothetical protein
MSTDLDFARWVECAGEAHKPGNGMIDNCGVCIPFWQKYPVCKIDGAKLKLKETCLKCPRCNKKYSNKVKK